MAFRTKHKVHSGKYVYVMRNKKGQITDVQNIGRAIRTDSRYSAENTPTSPGHGFAGDYGRKPYKFKAKRRTQSYSGVFGKAPQVKVGLY